ncbi:MAG: hypothetical protein ACREQY_06720, partial [Candidatus Binatia bacterium]
MSRMGNEQWRPPKWAYAPFTPILAMLLRSRRHRLISDRMMLLSYVGSRTGRTYTFPIGWFSWGENAVLSFSSTRWPRRLRSGSRVRLLLQGKRHDAVPKVFLECEEVAGVLGEFVARKGPRTARQLLLGLP